MNIYHISHSPQVGIVHLHFWGCNLNCRACFRKQELHDCHLMQTKGSIFEAVEKNRQTPKVFLKLEEVMGVLSALQVRGVIFMGAEPTIDPELPELAEALHEEFGSYNTLLTNGFIFPDLKDIDEVVVSIKAYTDGLHRNYTGKSNKVALENFVKYHRSGVKLRSESIFIPDYIDCAEIEKISTFISQVDRSIPYRIDAYIPIGNNPWRRPTLAEMQKAVDVARKHLVNVSCLTGNEELKFEVLRVI